MKRTIMILAFIATFFGARAQFLQFQERDNIHVGIGALLTNRILIENFELGVDNKKNTFSFVAQTFDLKDRKIHRNDEVLIKYGERLWFGGVKYYRRIPIAGNLSLAPNGSVMVNISNDATRFQFIPGLSLDLRLFDGVDLQLLSAYPITEKRKVNSAYTMTGLQTGLQLAINLF